MEVFFLIFLSCLVGTFLGFLLFVEYLKYKRKKLYERIDRVTNNILEQLRESVLDCFVEEHHGEFFVYKKDNSEFLVQGKNYNDICEALRKKYPDMHFNVDQTTIDLLKSKNITQE